MKKLLALFIFTLPAYGSIFLEPYLGITADGELEILDEDARHQGTSYGAKFGFQYTYLFGALDYRIATLSVDSDDFKDFFGGDTLSVEQYFLIGGVEFPAPIKAWFGAALGGKANTSDYDFTEGQGFLAGVAYTGLPLVSLNFEAVRWSYDKSDPGDDIELDGNHYLFSLSLPIHF